MVMKFVFSKDIVIHENQWFPDPFQFPKEGTLTFLDDQLTIYSQFEDDLFQPKLAHINLDGTIVFRGYLPRESGTSNPIEVGYLFVYTT